MILSSNTSILTPPPQSLSSNEYWGSFPEVKRPEREVDHSPPSSVDVGTEWTNTATDSLCPYGRYETTSLLYLFIYLFMFRVYATMLSLVETPHNRNHPL